MVQWWTVRVAKISFSIQGIDFESHAYVIDLVVCDMVLGVSWLQTLGNIY